MKVEHNYPQYLAEFVGTFFLVFFGCGSIIMSQLNSDFAENLIPFIFGGIVTVMIYATGHLSGAHFNPAVTISFWVIGRFPKQRVPFYLLSQIMGAVTASFFHFLLWGKDVNFGATAFTANLFQGVFFEFLLSFLLMFVIVSVATDSRAVGELAGLAIGMTVCLCALFGGPLTGASMNPARSLGPALFNGDLSQLWVYMIFPVIGAVCGAKTYEWIRCKKESSGMRHGCC